MLHNSTCLINFLSEHNQRLSFLDLPRPASWDPLLGEVWHPSLEGTMDGDHFQFYFYP
jgi:hypothetical protein